MKVAIVVFDGVDELDAVDLYEALRRASQHGAALEARLVTLGRTSTVKGSHGLTVVAEGTLDEPYDWIEVRPDPPSLAIDKVACFRPSHPSARPNPRQFPGVIVPRSVRARSIHITISTQSKALSS
jgi:hypothetical protein